jgi:hypothetical protein
MNFDRPFYVSRARRAKRARDFSTAYDMRLTYDVLGVYVMMASALRRTETGR